MMNWKLFFLRAALTSLTLFAVAGAAFAQTAPENIFKNPMIASATLSPNGKYLATTANIGGRLQLAVVDAETGTAKIVAGYETLDVYGIRWINDERIAFNIIDRDGEQTSSYAGLYAINRDGSNSAILMESPEHIRGRMDLALWASEPRYLQMVGVFKGDPNSIIGLGQFNNLDVLPYRVDSLTGKRKEIDFDVKGLARGFVFDTKNQLRVVITATVTQSDLTLWYREQVGQAWKKLSEHSNLDPKFTVLALTRTTPPCTFPRQRA
jgi:hypothetical protein